MELKENFKLLINRYWSQKDYTSNSIYLLSKNEVIKSFIINFFDFFNFNWYKLNNNFWDNLKYNIDNSYSIKQYINFQDKQNWDKRKIYFPYLYTFLE